MVRYSRRKALLCRSSRTVTVSLKISAASRPLEKKFFFLGQAACDTRQFFRKTARKTVDADSDNQTVDFAVFEVGLRFCKDAADFFYCCKKGR